MRHPFPQSFYWQGIRTKWWKNLKEARHLLRSGKASADTYSKIGFWQRETPGPARWDLE